MLEVARIEVDAERLAVPDRVERAPRRHEVVGDLGRVHLEPEAHALRVEHVHDRTPPLRELVVRALDRREVVGRERVEEVPDRRAREAVHLRHTELRGRAARSPSSLRGARRGRPPGRRRRTPRGGGSRGGARRSGRRPPDRRGGRRSPRRRDHAVRAARAAPSRIRGRQTARSTSKWSPQHASSRPSKPQRGALGGQLLERQVGPLAGEERDGSVHRDPPSTPAVRARARPTTLPLRTTNYPRRGASV